VIKVKSAEEMAGAVRNELQNSNIFIGAAAVADYRPAKQAAQKIKKHSDSLTLDLERTPDILAHVSANRHDGLLVIGFAAETENLVANAQAKLRSKNLDIVVANDVTVSNSGFDSDTNTINIITRGEDEPLGLPSMSKAAAANKVLDAIVHLRSGKATAKTSSS